MSPTSRPRSARSARACAGWTPGAGRGRPPTPPHPVRDAPREAVAAYNKRVDAYTDKVRSQQDPGQRSGPFSDPGLVKQQSAQEALAEARRQRNEAASVARGVVQAAPAVPPGPRLPERHAGRPD
ncbi:putative T7SS-secreted protein [Streptomyces violascens]|uniref:putative T7SS-secreted protein n=1 Tax=Streptomyces violascens TaxID=67381 RepID=UPI0037A97A34